jgi:hypothetical protein
MGADAAPIRVSVDAEPGVLGDVVRRTIRNAPGLELVTVPSRVATANAPVADVVILAGTDPDTITWPTPELGCAATRLLAISDDGHTGCLFELLPRREMLGELTPEALIAAVRAPLPRVVASRAGGGPPTDHDPAQGRHPASGPRDHDPEQGRHPASGLAPMRPNADQED